MKIEPARNIWVAINKRSQSPDRPTVASVRRAGELARRAIHNGGYGCNWMSIIYNERGKKLSILNNDRKK